MSAPSINPVSAPIVTPITERPLPNGVNPFDQLAPELVEHILDNIGLSRPNVELACQHFYSFATQVVDAGKKWINALDNLYFGSIEPFYPIFKKRMRQLNVEFPSDAFMGRIREFPKFLDGQFSEEYLRRRLPDLIRGVSSALLTQVFNDAIQSYADQDIEKMTHENFNERVEFLKKHYYYSNTRLTIETLIRKAIKRDGTDQQAQRTADIESVRREFANPSPDAPRFIRAQKSLIAKLEQEKKKLEAKRLELCGPNGFNGTIDAAHQEVHKATAGIASALHYAGGKISERCDQIASEIASGFFSPPRVLVDIRDYGANMLRYLNESAYTQKAAQHATLVAELAAIAQYDQKGQLIGGQLFQIGRALQPDSIARRAREEVTRQAGFLEELNQDVAEGAEEARSQALHEIYRD